MRKLHLDETSVTHESEFPSGTPKEIDALKAELKEQKALIQAVNDKVELNKSAPQTVLNDQ